LKIGKCSSLRFRRLIHIAVILILIDIQSGCCTIKTQQEIERGRNGEYNKDILCYSRSVLDTTIVYSGTYWNVNKLILMPLTCHGEGCWLAPFYPFILIGGLIDLPLDIMADTMILPRTIPLAMETSSKCRALQLENKEKR
jgi:uncharacterized protein YceK